ncbi:hypothetical protein LX64_04156 [Chitinophaga skermanii]|uniref:Uncharacterized protein n=1 Tax=Chitinophaga skermanii TaxID=331697 RepID=A0A327Q7S2_9BACT|nr:hypothetical protein LX64_04156 [Chitinophaga skermanii]
MTDFNKWNIVDPENVAWRSIKFEEIQEHNLSIMLNNVEKLLIATLEISNLFIESNLPTTSLSLSLVNIETTYRLLVYARLMRNKSISLKN